MSYETIDKKLFDIVVKAKAKMQQQLADIHRAVAPYASPASNVQTHELADKVLKILGER